VGIFQSDSGSGIADSNASGQGRKKETLALLTATKWGFEEPLSLDEKDRHAACGPRHVE
jgi:hypothetical protein